MSRLFKVKDKYFVAGYGEQTCLEPICLDIETSHLPDNSLTWIVSIQVLWENEYHLFRTGEELCNWYNDIIDKYKLGWNGKNVRKVITFIHNASYDLSYLIPYFKTYLPDYINEDGTPLTDDNGRQIITGTIIQGAHEVLQYAQGGLLWRCSYKLSGRSLANWGEVLGIKNKKKIGMYDYDAVLFPDMELDTNSLEYDKFDVLALQECLKKQMSLNGEALTEYDNLKRVPLTVTGYVRRDLTESCVNSSDYINKIFKASRLSGELYHACLSSYAGGYTHNNRFYKDKLIEVGKEYVFNKKKIKVEKIGHRDFKSHYPSQMRTRVYPLGKWQVIYDLEYARKPIFIKEVLNMYPKYSNMVFIRINKADIKDSNISMPFLQVCKLIYKKDSCKYIVADNGRVLYMSAYEGCYFEMYIDNVTLSILNEQYNLDYQIVKVWRSVNKPLPKEITSVIDKYFKGKSDKKNYHKECIKNYGEFDERTIDAGAELQLVKGLLNATYGCMAQAIVRDEWYIDPVTYEFKMQVPFKVTDDKETIAEAIYNNEVSKVDYFYEKRNSCLPYQVGLYITAYAREELYRMIVGYPDKKLKGIGYENILYCDTDSAYYITNDVIENRIDKINKYHHSKAPYVVLNNGTKEYYDYFDSEGYIKAFKGLHSKCYGFVNDNDEFMITIAGVPRRTLIGMENDKPIYLTREDELRYYKGGERVCKECSTIEALDKLTDGYTFYINTGTVAKYLTTEDGKIKEYEIDGHKFTSAGGCIISKAKTKNIKPFDIKIQGDYKEGV